MTDTVAPAQPPPTPAPTAETHAHKRTLAQKSLGELFALMQLPARVDVKEAADGSISVAVMLETELPGVGLGRRSHFVDALQFLVNKLVNKPGTARHWVVIGVGAHPEPRTPKPPRSVVQEGAPASNGQTARPPPPAPGGGTPPRPAPSAPPKPAAPPPTRARPREQDSDERALEGPEDGELRVLAGKLAAKSASLGRFYALVGMKPLERAEVLRGAGGVAGVTLSAEGEGRNRRVVFSPAKPAPMPKRALPADDDEYEDE